MGRTTKGILCLAGIAYCALALRSDSSSIGLFEDHTDIGTVLHPGSADYDAASNTYTLTGSGENMWFATDDFHFMWKKISATDAALTADISILGTGGDNHRKAVLMFRQSLDPDSPYADAALHGNGLTSLQFRDEKGAAMHEIESNISAPKRLRIEKRGDRFYMWIGSGRGKLDFAGGSARVAMKAPFYVGIGVCAHNKDAIQKAAFTNVGLSTTETNAGTAPMLYSTLETVTVASTDARVSYVTRDHIEAPSWTPDGASLIFHSSSGIERVPVAGGTPETIASTPETQSSSRVSPDGKQMVSFSHAKDNQEVVLSVTQVANKSSKVVAKLVGGRGTLGPHPWSPDSKRLTFISYQSIE